MRMRTLTCSITSNNVFHDAYDFFSVQETPALSRSMNMECYVEGFYDYHDVWHFFSACGMFFAFLVSYKSEWEK